MMTNLVANPAKLPTLKELAALVDNLKVPLLEILISGKDDPMWVQVQGSCSIRTQGIPLVGAPVYINGKLPAGVIAVRYDTRIILISQEVERTLHFGSREYAHYLDLFIEVGGRRQ